MQCPKCKYHADHVYTFEVSPKTGKQWAIERCPNCLYAGWPDNPVEYADHLKNRAQKRHDRRDIRDHGNKWGYGV